MEIVHYLKSLGRETNALRSRVRDIIGDRHWPTDGEFKESILRSMIRRHLPSQIRVVRGFIITDKGPSKQIDVLLYDSNWPVFYQDGDLVFVPSGAVVGIIEVKTRTDRADFKKHLFSLADNASYTCQKINGKDYLPNVFIGLFSYESNVSRNDIRKLLKIVQEVSKNKPNRIISYIALGENFFVRFWPISPDHLQNYNKWHAYILESKAVGYFLHNVIESISDKEGRFDETLWYPKTSKEDEKIGEIEFSGNLTNR